MKILVLDNYDSFTYNLVYQLRELGYSPDVYRNDKISIEDVGNYDKILLSPGPGIPDEAGITKDVIRVYGPEKSILGVCLGHQAIAEVYTASLYNLEDVLHGVTSEILIEDPQEYLFRNIPSKFRVCHYHSWAVSPSNINGKLKVTATNDQGLIMAIAHTQYDVRGVQFHPEAILTENGKQIMANWINNEKLS